MGAVDKLKPIKRGNAWHIHGTVIPDNGQTKTKVRETTGKPITSTTEAEGWALVQKRFDEISSGVTGDVTIDVLARKFLSARSFDRMLLQTIERFAQDLGHLLMSELTAEQYYNWAYQTWRERKVSLNQMAVDALPRGWLEMDDDDLIFTVGSEQIEYGQVNYRWNQAKQLMGIENKELTPHTARHTFATLLLFDDGVDLSFVAQLIGDTIPICEKRYIHARPEKAANALKRAGVLGEHNTITSVAPLKEAPRHAPVYGKIPNILGSTHLQKDRTSVGTTPLTSLTQV